MAACTDDTDASAINLAKVENLVGETICVEQIYAKKMHPLPTLVDELVLLSIS